MLLRKFMVISRHDHNTWLKILIELQISCYLQMLIKPIVRLTRIMAFEEKFGSLWIKLTKTSGSYLGGIDGSANVLNRTKEDNESIRALITVYSEMEENVQFQLNSSADTAWKTIKKGFNYLDYPVVGINFSSLIVAQNDRIPVGGSLYFAPIVMFHIR